MGSHALDMTNMSNPLTATLGLGYWNGDLIFLAPFVSREWMMSLMSTSKQIAVFPIAKPAMLPSNVEFWPSNFIVSYNRLCDQFEIALIDFAPVTNTLSSQG